jgi:hypothetical protein
MEVQCLLEPGSASLHGQDESSVAVLLRFLQVQTRTVEELTEGQHVPVAELLVDGRSLLSWEEAVEREELLPSYDLTEVFAGGAGALVETVVDSPAHEEVEVVVDGSGAAVGRIVRRREPLRAAVAINAQPDEGCARLTVAVQNTHPEAAPGKDDAIRLSMIGTHVLIQAHGATEFVSLLEPPDHAADAAGRCRQERCFPVLVGSSGATDMVLGSPIILYDYPEIAAESAGALFDSTEIDEILTLRVMTMTDAEKAEARATDPRAAEIIARCDDMSTETLRQLHGALRDPHASLPPVAEGVDVRNAEGPDFETGGVPWWDPAQDEAGRSSTRW